jgi:hypothetical protein
MTEYVIRFLVGAAVVSAFAMLGDLLRPKSFAGLFGTAPSVALATLGAANGGRRRRRTRRAWHAGLCGRFLDASNKQECTRRLRPRIAGGAR